MENLPNPEDVKLYITCGECEENVIMETKNTIIFEDQQGGFQYYTQCPNECEPTIGEISPEHMQYFNYFEHWYDKEGNKITELKIGGIIIGEEMEVVDVRTWDMDMQDFLTVYQPEPWEFPKYSR